MKRRHFLASGAAGAVGMGAAGCSSFGLGKIDVKQEQTPMELDKKVPKPKGIMPYGEIGKTGIKVSKFGFGSHMRNDLIPYEKEREWMVREAYDLGVNLFDIYDYEGRYFQYEPMGRHLAPIINNVVVSITMFPFDGRSLEQELERDLRLLGRDHIDMVRIHAWKNSYDPEVLQFQISHRWDWWETLFKMKEQGKIRAVGVPIHTMEDLKEPLAELPLDFVIFPYNFYHNWLWGTRVPDPGIHKIVPELREKGIGVVTMKPFAGDFLVAPFKRLGNQFDESGEVNVAKASLRYIINSDLDLDTTLGGMYNPYHVYEDIDAYFNPVMSSEEARVLKKIRKTSRIVAKGLLPDHYQFLEDWAPDSLDDSDLTAMA